MAMDMDMASVHTAVAHDTARWAQCHAGSLASSASTRAVSACSDCSTYLAMRRLDDEVMR